MQQPYLVDRVLEFNSNENGEDGFRQQNNWPTHYPSQSISQLGTRKLTWPVTPSFLRHFGSVKHKQYVPGDEFGLSYCLLGHTSNCFKSPKTVFLVGSEMH